MSDTRAHRAGRSVARAPILIVVVVALIGGGLIDRVSASSGPPSVPAVQPVPVAAPIGALSSSWFCAGATDAGRTRGDAPGSVIIANSASSAATAVVNLVPSRGPRRAIPVTVPAGSRTVVAENVHGGTPWIGAIVDVDAGGVSVEQQIDGRYGRSASPCATSGSPDWYFTNGATLVNAGVELSLLNPYPVDSVVDLSFTTDQGQENPEGFQGLVVPAGGMLNVNLGDHLRRRQWIATTVAARTGRIVAWKTDWVQPPAPGAVIMGTKAALSPLADPAAPVTGVTVTLGASSAGTSWTWADGMSGNGLDERYVIYNPGQATAEVKLAVTLEQGVAEPFDLAVGPGQVTIVTSAAEARIPAGVAHSAVLTSTNGVPVVAERVLTAASPARWSGIGELPGGRVAAARWLLAGAPADRTHRATVVLYNPGNAPVSAVLSPLGAPPIAGGRVLVGPGRRVAVTVNPGTRPVVAPLLLQASGPVFAELGLYGENGATGVSLSFGVPLTPAGQGGG